MMKFKYIGLLEAVNLNINKRIEPGDIVDVPEDLVDRFEGDKWFEKVDVPKQTVKSTSKVVKGDK